jgi:hypothetical protein
MTNEGIRPTRFDMIANQMMKGCNGKVQQNNIAGTKQQIEDFHRIYGSTIRYLEEKIPKTVSTAVAGAIGKAILWHGREEMEPFVEAFSNREFKGHGDPCLALWEWLIRNNKRNTNEIYRRAVTAIRIFLRGGSFKGHLKPALDDIFEWENNFRTMRQPRKNQHTLNSSASPTKQTEEAMLADIEDTLSGSPT